ncbi:MAG: NAD(P)/FAD-dependent oxidoreductase [Intrasporangium sp.]|uniref:flavin-containing monooxygenase n=1 Tax=Intrasporangium sp. TaxID=1925024 RepID=UPI002648BCA9|nr:NAD(P)/FAD-dependent oxidoreductase [Intrasporangium sp.]MDN5795530.1 NAD(P)/FAD-dependent oxidoreductase [Intrasporangium sp.]
MGTNETHANHATSTANEVSTVIIGAGQAGLATAQALMTSGHDCVVLERNDRLGDNWRHHYDSLHLYTPARYDGLPGFPFPGDPHACPGKDEVADYLQAYAAHFSLPVRLGVHVVRLAGGGTAHGNDDSRFVVETDAGTYHCNDVVVATGTFGRAPRVPEFARDLDPGVLQLHSSEYRRPSQLAPGPVLVVGASHSGCDIAYELAETRQTTLVGRDCGEIPIRWDSWQTRMAVPVLVFAWRHVLTRRTPIGRRAMPHIRHHGGPMLRVKRADLAARGVLRNPSRVEGVRGGRPVLGDGTVVDVANIVWATGFEQHFDWIDLPIVGDDGWPREYRGVADEVPGLYFCGLAFQYAFSSMVLPGVGRDARYLADRIASDRSLHERALVSVTA